MDKKKVTQEAIIENVKKTFEEVDKADVDNKLELMKYQLQIQNRLKKDISSDFVLAKLDSADKEGVIKMTANAYMCKKLIEIKINRSYTWKWENNKWKKVWFKDNKNLAKPLLDVMDVVFDTIMLKVHMTAVLNRNVKNNYLVRITAGLEEEHSGKDNDEWREKVNDKIEGKEGESA